MGLVAIVQDTPTSSRCGKFHADRSSSPLGRSPAVKPLRALTAANSARFMRAAVWLSSIRHGCLGQRNFLAQPLHAQEPEDVPPPCLGLRRHRR